MRIKQLLRGPISGILMLSVPLLALLSLSHQSSASQVGLTTQASATLLSDVASDAPGVGRAKTSLSEWKYTGNSVKSTKSKKSPKSKKSKKSKK